MTTGSWTTLKESLTPSSCSSQGHVRNGTTVNWFGDDASVKKRPKQTWRERRALFLKNPMAVPFSKGQFKVDAAKAAQSGASNNIFDTARERRIKVFDGPPLDEGDYRSPHAFTKVWTRYQESLFTWFASDGTPYTGTIAHCGFSAGATTDPWTADHDYKLLERLRKKVVGTDFNLASFLGAEGRDTVRFLADSTQRLARTLMAAKKLDFPLAYNTLRGWGRYKPRKSVDAQRRAQQEDVYRDLFTAGHPDRSAGWIRRSAAQWLELHLAIEPLFGDIVAAAEMLAHVTQMPRSQKVQAMVRVRSPYPNIHPGPYWTGERQVKKSVVAYFTSEPDPASFLGLQNPEVTIWNAIPLSFVADYMLNIGGFLEANMTARAFPEGLYVTSRKDETRLTAALGMTGATISADDQKFQKYTTGSFVRSLSTVLDVPKPVFKPYGVLKNWQRAATASALIVSIGSGLDVRFFR